MKQEEKNLDSIPQRIWIDKSSIKQAKARSVGSYYFEAGDDDGLPYVLAESYDAVADDAAWKIAQVLCDFCGEKGYNLIYHHEEWRHYRQSDMYQYCYCKAYMVYQLYPNAANCQALSKGE